MTPDEVAAFERVDWIFLEPSAQARQLIVRGEKPEGTIDVGSVVRDEDGRLAIVNEELVVKLAPQLTDAETHAFLTAHHIEVIRQLRFAPNLFEVRAVDGKDGIDKSVELHGDPNVVSAEPNLIDYRMGYRVTMRCSASVTQDQKERG